MFVDAEIAGQLGWGRGKVARRAGVKERGRHACRESDEQFVSAGTILAEARREVFSKR